MNSARFILLICSRLEFKGRSKLSGGGILHVGVIMFNFVTLEFRDELLFWILKFYSCFCFSVFIKFLSYVASTDVIKAWNRLEICKRLFSGVPISEMSSVFLIFSSISSILPLFN